MDSKILELLKQYTRHAHIKITNSGNLAIFAAFYAAKQKGIKEILIPDQGGWLTYKEYAMVLGIKATELKTEHGVINPKELEKYKNKAIIFTSFAGYFAEQPLEEISKVCRKNNILLIEDASGSIGDNVLCNGNFSDIIVGSFGRWKIVDLHQGGFISANNKELLHKEIDSLTKPINIDEKKLYEKLKNAKERLNALLKNAEEVKKQLNGFEIIHKDKRGINVIAKYDGKVIEFCKKNKYEYTICPREIRVLEKAVSIELKR